MINCDKCKEPVSEGEGRKHNSKTLCEDCYIDSILSTVRKTYYENDAAEFMRRLTVSYSVRQQKYQ